MKVRIEVVHALADVQTVIEVELAHGARVADALDAARLRSPVFEGSPPALRIGIWGAPASPDTELRDGDRLEIYRDLLADPKQARRQRVRLQRAASKRD